MSEVLDPRPGADNAPTLPGTWRQRLFVQFMRPVAGEVVALVEGEVDLSNADDLVELVASQALGRRELVVDLSGVDFLDTTAAVALVTLDGLVRAGGTALRVVVSSARVLRPLALLGLLDTLTVECRTGGVGSGDR